MQPTIPNPLVSSVQVTHLVQVTLSSHVTVNSSISPVSGQSIPPPGGQISNVSMMFGTTTISGSQPHMVGMNQPSLGSISHPVGPAGSSNVQYQQPDVGPSGSSGVQYQQPNVGMSGSSHVQYQ